MRIVVTGGTGFVGRSVCERLSAQHPGAQIVVPSRQAAAARRVSTVPGVQRVQADLFDPGTLSQLLQGADALVHLVAILHGSPAQFDRVHVQLPRLLATAVRACGVQRVVHVSALAVSEDAPSSYLRSKAAGERVWKEAAAAVGAAARPAFQLAVLRPSVIFGDDDRFTNLFASLLRLLPLLPLAGADARFQPVAVGDVAQAIAACVLRQQWPLSAQDPVLDCAGPEVLTLAQVFERIGRMSGHSRPVLPLPEIAGVAQAMLMGLLPGDPLMSRDNLLSMRVPNIASGQHAGLEALGITPVGLDSLSAHFRPQPAYDR